MLYSVPWVSSPPTFQQGFREMNISGISAPGFQKSRQAPEDSQGGDATQHQWLWYNSSYLGQPNPSLLPVALQLMIL